MPISTIYNYVYQGSNVCSIDGSPGGDELPELSWKNAPRGTRTFAIVVFDETAGVVHWGMYNNPGHDYRPSTERGRDGKHLWVAGHQYLRFRGRQRRFELWRPVSHER
jgi:phosphatidylethanolamine-binding protein (PEBP) family uncharacterized protein